MSSTLGAVIALMLPIVVSSQTAGCDKIPPQTPGTSTTVNIQYEGVSRKYIIYVPSGYRPEVETPVVFSFHGWGSSAAFNEGYMGLTKVADNNGYIVIYPEGRSDYQRATNSGWQSFNAVGSTTTLGNECTKSTTGYCYQSCNARPQKCGRCDWTSCTDDAGFVDLILDQLEATYCMDKKRYYATGYSNGGMMAYEVGMSNLKRFAAIVPGGGQPFVGHNNPPPVSSGGYISVLDLHGSRDRTCPANDTTSSDGWNYEPVDNVLKVWAAANGCTETTKLKRFVTDEDGNDKLYCVSFGECDKGVDIVRCSYNAAHQWLGYGSNGGTGARLAFAFFERHQKLEFGTGKLSANQIKQNLRSTYQSIYQNSTMYSATL